MKNTTFESAKNLSSFAHVCMTACVALMSIMTSNTIIAQDVKREGKVYVEQKNPRRLSLRKRPASHTRMQKVCLSIFISVRLALATSTK